MQKWLELHFPKRVNKVLNAIRSTRDGELYQSKFHTRMRGSGPRADLIHDIFKMACRKYHLNKKFSPLSTEHFRRKPAQVELFD